MIKVSNMATNTITFNSIVSPSLIINITVAIVPGPVNKGMAIGKIETSSLRVASRISSAVTLSRETLACIISSATVISNIPPATLKQSSVTPKNLKSSSPDTAKMIANRHATPTERFTVAFLSPTVIPEVSEIKVINPATGFTITNIDANA